MIIPLCFNLGSVREIVNDELSFLKTWLPTWLYIMGLTLKINLISFFAGYMGDEYLAGIGLGSTLLIATDLFLVGFTSVFDVYGPQLCGRGLHSQLSRLMVKVLLQGFTTFLMLTPIFVGMYYSIRYIPLIGEDEESADIKRIAERFLILSAGLCPLDYVIGVFFKFLIQHRATSTVYGFTVILIFVQCLLGYIFVVLFKMKTEGIIFSSLFSRLLTVVMSMMTMFYNRTKWHLSIRQVFTSRIFQNFWKMTKKGVASGLMLLFTISTFTVAVFLSQVRGRVAVEVITVALYYSGISLSAGAAVAVTSAVQIGNALGSKDEAETRYKIKLSVANLFAERVIFLVVMFLTRRWYYSLFTQDQIVISDLMESGYIYAGMITFACIQEVLAGGVLLAFGKTSLISSLTIACSCLVGLPLTLGLVFTTDLTAIAFFSAMLVEKGIAIVASCFIVVRLDLSVEIAKCAARLEKEVSDINLDETDGLLFSNPVNSDQHSINSP